MTDNYFNACKSKLEWYLDSGKELKSDVWKHLHAYRTGDKISFYDGCDLITEFNFGDYPNNLLLATQWLLEGQKKR